MEPEPMPEDMQANTPWEHHWGRFDGQSAPRDLARAEAIRSMVPDGVSLVLEVGCGDGLIINGIDAPDTMGVDLSAEGLRSVTGPCLQCSVEKLPFEDGRYELVIASEVLEHLPEDIYRRSIAEIARVAGRYVLVSVPNRENLKANMTKCPACGGEYHRNLHQRSYRRGDLERLFPGFQEVTCLELGETEAARTRLEVSVRRGLKRGMPRPWNTVCPHCNAAHGEPGHGPDEPPARGARPGASAPFWSLKSIAKVHKKPWLAALYARRD
jgi:SAM-dependent methyltransferase